MKALHSLIILFFISISALKAQTVYITITNQAVVGTDFFFDLNIATASSTLYLGDCDFNIPFNAANFSSSSALSRVSGTSSLLTAGGGATSYVPATSKTIAGSVLTINLQGPGPVDQPDFDSRVAAIGTSPTRISRFKISLITNTAGFSGLTCGTFNINGYDINDLSTPYSEGFKSTTCTTPTNVALPLTLLKFALTITQSESIALNWLTVDEKNVNGFDIQRSTDGVSFSSLDFKKSSGGGAYIFIDNNVTKGQIYYYRLNMLDNDGTSSLSKIVSARIEGSFSIKIYPNPTKETAIIDIAGTQTANIRVTDVLGREIFLKNDAGAKNEISLSDYPNGIYFIEVRADGEKFVRKLVKE